MWIYVHILIILLNFCTSEWQGECQALEVQKLAKGSWHLSTLGGIHVARVLSNVLLKPDFFL